MGGNCPVYVLPSGVEEAMEVSTTGSELSANGGSLLGTKRPHEDDDESRKRENWPMNEVAILARPLVNLYSGELRSLPVTPCHVPSFFLPSLAGRVAKVDGPCVIVRFPPAPGEEDHGHGEEDMLARCRALKIEDLVVS